MSQWTVWTSVRGTATRACTLNTADEPVYRSVIRNTVSMKSQSKKGIIDSD
jgi:hypothetical protein